MFAMPSEGLTARDRRWLGARCHDPRFAGARPPLAEFPLPALPTQ